MQVEFRTDRGRIRHHNEDSGGVFENKTGNPIVIVADGMGGHRAGDVASEMAVKLLSEAWQETEEFLHASDVEEWFRITIQKINRAITSRAEAEPELKGMGTTLVAAIFTRSQAIVANVGDSRGYLLQEERFKQITEDHSLVNELLRKGEISKEDAENHPRKNILLRALGVEGYVDTDTFITPFQIEDILLLCSDGLSNMISEEEMKQVLMSRRTLAEKADTLITKANANGGEDNITVLLLERDKMQKGGRAS
ncbi:Stp1/IreP family PP2C-type Ser/Thr phosphatase [Listeria fleischmannii]|jgi:serine/threonine protein phosphatase PrpC|uniref:Serine/threonine phosphatase stp n=2 Tax=Listeria fleischmannii TaxID=1069827 RepID=W7D1Q5_9LIST|nr:Stp1/IreP family PP2C-type Ser/Thr phosphatase [Listeria fleischmannii]EIA20432.1 serine/threonine phosphatase stp [Listeria fleischmannii subsp. coloradonensis]EUJ42905.1 serine/threonine protein phosphatase [Listeria fleischmannii FSL S10-1203]MBC1399502.1 Stp1/IreP family PP2C-type Ser/Thr phosphatase [Listeria fleischmannii]MBC1418903.1 Stp1/IreP family PP2C-type Ser/Thr phosphatase [Listeria fleischmannii]MBC1428234.1 Stp1/IreP family PP2C-type Ser/Thr phosphatase [Listeria fleischmann